MVDKPSYKKVSSRAGSLVSYSQLWKGPDHLLLVKETGCIEEYKRFYYRDIQAFVTVRSIAFLTWTILLLIFSLGLTGAALSVKHAGRYVALGFLIPVVLALVIHLIRGPMCKCWLQTGVNKERLIMFPRAAQVRRFWKKIEPEIIAAQGIFSVEEMSEERRQTESSPATASTSEPDVS